jgi:ABC-type siderophore export system fused ATPase/permease subunit
VGPKPVSTIGLDPKQILISSNYTQLLPELRANGKTVVVITLDEKYFPVADRVIKLDYGHVNGVNGTTRCDLKPLVKA